MKTHYESSFSNSTNVRGLISNDVYSIKDIENRISYTGIRNKLDQYHSYGKYFTINNGQVNSEVEFYIQGKGIWFTSTGVVLELREPIDEQPEHFNKFEMTGFDDNKESINIQYKRKVVTFEFVNCNNINPIGIEELFHKSNFFYGNDSGKWCTDLSNYKSILYRDIYKYIDLKYYFNEEGLKYDFIVQPGGDPNDIAIKVSGAEELILDIGNSGTMTQPPHFNTPHTTHHTPLCNHSDIYSDSLTIKTGLADIVDTNLFVYQEHNDKITEVGAGFRLINSNCYGFSISWDYNKNTTLIIDPQIYSTYLGGFKNESIEDIKLDNNNNVYITGWTESSNFPVTNGSNDTSLNGNQDVFIIKMNSDGSSLMYSTFIGGVENDIAYALSIRADGITYITGNTGSSDFPTTPDAYDTTYNGGNKWRLDVFVCKLNNEGNKFNYSTYIGGGGIDPVYDLLIDEDGNAYVTGYTHILDPVFPTTPGAYQSINKGPDDIFITILSNNGSEILTSTLIGGGQSDLSYSLTIDKDKNIYLTGATGSSDFPVTNGSFDEQHSSSGSDGFVLILNANMTSILYSTFIGGAPSHDVGTSIHLDSLNNIYISGITWSLDFPTTSNAYDRSFNGNFDVFISVFNGDLSVLLYSTYIGGKNADLSYDSSFDSSGNMYIVGSTNSSDYPVLDGALDTNYNGNKDVFISKFNFSGPMLVYSSFIGSNNDDIGNCIFIDNNGHMNLAGNAGADFPTTNNSFDPLFNGGGYDAFLILGLKLTSTASIVDLNISKPFVYRSDEIFIFSNASDFEDDEVQIRPHFEYKPTVSFMPWTNLWLWDPIYLNNRWQTNFSVPINATLGYYNFRVRYNDTDNLWSRWYYLNESLLVLNNPPYIDYFNLSKSIVVIDEAFSLLVNGSDVEDGLQALTFQPQYKFSDDIIWNDIEFDKPQLIDTKWEYTMTMGPDMEYGYYDFRVWVNDSDMDFSSWSYLFKSLLVLPAPPDILSISLSKNIIYRTDVFEVYINTSDPDSIKDDLFVELQYSPIIESKWYNLSVDVLENHFESNVKSKTTWTLGNYSFRARATDMEDNTSPWYYLNNSLRVLNNVPEILSIENIPEQMDRGNFISISLNAKDKENPEDTLVIEFTYQLPGRLDWLSDYLSVPNYSENSWQYQFSLPYNAPTGAYSFRAQAQDLDNDWSNYFYLNDSMRVINHAPEVIAFDQTPNEVFRTEIITITAEGRDFETLPQFLNCSMYFLEPDSQNWQGLNAQYNESPGTWNTDLITTKSSILGNYSFKVLFIDSDEMSSKPWYYNQTVWVKNNLPEISSDLDNIEVGKNQRILKLTDFGYDVETFKSNLIWIVDQSTINTKLFHIETENIGNQELVIYPVKSKEGNDDITITLIDADNGRAVKRDITINVNSKSGGGAGPGDEDSPVQILTSGESYWIYIIILIVVILLIVFFIMYRRKKAKEEDAKKAMEEKALKEKKEEETVEPVVPPQEDIETARAVAVPAAESVPVIEEPSDPVPVPMPVEAEKPQLLVGNVEVTQESQKPAQPKPEASKTQIELVITEENPEYHVEEENNKNNE